VPADVGLRECCAAYCAAYTGRDAFRVSALAVWAELLGADTPIASIDADLVADALEQLATTPAMRYLGKDAAGNPRWKNLGLRKPSTINRYKASLSALLAWAHRRRLLPRGYVNPCRQIRGEAEHNARVRFLTEAERERLLTICRASAWPRLYLLVLLALTTGARKGELLALRVGDLDLSAATARLRTSKNREPRVLPLVPAVVAEIGRQRLPKDAGALLFPNLRGDGPREFTTVWRRAVDDARLLDFKFHDLRHSCASYLAQSGASLLEIADVLGHRQLDVTKRYAHLTVNTKAALVSRVLGGIGKAA
jgi:integrase